MTLLEPAGRVLALLPRDFPVLEAVTCLVPAILAGNSILLKDHPGTPTIAPFFEAALQDAAPGLTQQFFVDPSDAQYVYQTRAVNYVAFSGTYQTALDVHFELGSNDFIDSSFDLGGLNFAYIDKTCDEEMLARAAEKCLWGAFYNSGQSRT